MPPVCDVRSVKDRLSWMVPSRPFYTSSCLSLKWFELWMCWQDSAVSCVRLLGATNRLLGEWLTSMWLLLLHYVHNKVRLNGNESQETNCNVWANLACCKQQHVLINIRNATHIPLGPAGPTSPFSPGAPSTPTDPFIPRIPWLPFSPVNPGTHKCIQDRLEFS